MQTLKYSEIHLLAAVWNIYAVYARILEILDQKKKKNLPAVMGIKLNKFQQKYLYILTHSTV